MIGISSNQSTQTDYHTGRGATSYGMYSNGGKIYNNNDKNFMDSQLSTSVIYSWDKSNTDNNVPPSIKSIPNDYITSIDISKNNNTTISNIKKFKIILKQCI